MAMKTNTREPYGKSALTFTDGFTLTFQSDSLVTGEEVRHTLRFDRGWLSHFGAQPKEQTEARELRGFSRAPHYRA
jgi:hypothetical protein